MGSENVPAASPATHWKVFVGEHADSTFEPAFKATIYLDAGYARHTWQWTIDHPGHWRRQHGSFTYKCRLANQFGNRNEFLRY